MDSHFSFIHLRMHSAYSLSEGAIRINELGRLCHDTGMPALAITDSNNMFGAMEFSDSLARIGIQPIIGIQLSVDISNGEQQSIGVGGQRLREQHAPLVMLAKNETGYLNILKLLKIAYLDSDDASDPVITLDDIQPNSEGIITLTGGAFGPLGVLLRVGKTQQAEDCCQRLKEIFPDHLYVEIQRHGMQEELETEEKFIDLAYSNDLPLVATNEVYFPDRNMYEAHDALRCIAQGHHVADQNRFRLTPEHYFKSASEMTEVFADLPEAINNTITIARRCGYMVEKIAPLLPPFDCGEGRTEVEELKRQAILGLEKRLEDHVYEADMDHAAREKAAKPYFERIEFEINVIADMGFPGYFLIVWDFIHWAKQQGIPVGPGRGSGAGSVVAWALTITDLDPLRWGLLFERFLNPERVSMPDFDIDFCQDRRDEVIRYVQGKYGRDHVAQIITFGKLQARAVLRDVGRVLQMPYGYIDKICKMVPNSPANPVTLQEAINGEKELRQLIRNDPAVDRLVKIALKLEGLYRHASTHAAGVVIGDRPLEKLIPLYRDPRSDMPVTGYNMKFVESAGLVKFDFLGLKTLTVLATTVDLIAQNGDGEVIDPARIPLDDAKTFAMMGRGETTGVFQLESAGMRDVLRNLKPDVFEDIIAVVALYRPGPMDNIPSYINRKHGLEEVDYLYPTLEGILSETGGIIIYQEQVMQIAQVLAGYSLGGADILRRAMGKKIKEEMDQQRSVFVTGAVAKGVPEKRADEIFDLVDKFAGYGFNKSHAAAYALVAYQTAYMKAHYPVEFMAASMTLDLGNTDKLNVFRQELDQLGVELLQPDINRSCPTFSVERRDGQPPAIRYALGAIKNVGLVAMEGLVQERTENGPFKDLTDFVSRLDTTQVNKRQIENLVRAGAFDGFGFNRRQLFSNVDLVMKHASVAMSDKTNDQMGLFGGGVVEMPSIELEPMTEWSPMDRLREEFDAVGFYLSAHPLDAYQSLLKKLKAQSVTQVLAAPVDSMVSMAGVVIGKKERVSAKGNRYAFVQMSDSTGVFELTVFAETLSQSRDILEVGNCLFVKSNVQFEGETPRFTVQSLELLEHLAQNAPISIQVVINNNNALVPLKEVLDIGDNGRGEVIVAARLKEGPGGEDAIIPLPERYTVSPQLILAVRSLSGVVDVREL